MGRSLKRHTRLLLLQPREGTQDRRVTRSYLPSASLITPPLGPGKACAFPLVPFLCIWKSTWCQQDGKRGAEIFLCGVSCLTRVHVIQISYSEIQLSCCLFQHDETGLLKSKNVRMLQTQPPAKTSK